MKRLFATAMLLVGSTLMSSQLMALGLGELKLDSALNQPLKAEIELVDSAGLSEWEIKPVLASAEAFDRYGVDRSYFLTKIKFIVAGDKIELSTREGVTEPFLNFLVELNWPSGRVVREYTVLLDPPTFEQQSFQPVVAAPSVTPSTGQVQRQNNSIVTPSTGVASRQPAGSGAEGTYTVQPNDTMWAIALATRPDASVSPQQMMLAIQQANPNAFIGGNINRVKTFEVLRIPGADQVQGISRQVAVNEMARQNDELAGRAQLDATGRNTSVAPRATSDGRGEVRLVTDAKQGANSAGASGDTEGQGNGRQEALENDLAIALENLDKSRRDNAELEDRLTALEEQIAALQRLVTLKNDQLASMQAGAATAEAQQPVATVTPEPKPEVAAPAAVEPAKTEAQAAAQPEVAAKPEAQQPVERKPAPKRYVPPPPSLIDTILQDPMMLGGLVLAILLLIALIYTAIKRRLAGKDDSDEAAKEQAAIAAAVEEVNAVNEPVDSFDFDEPEQHDDPMDFLNDDSAVDISTASLESEDELLVEVEEHIAYGRFDEARGLLKNAIANEPVRGDLSLKLLEVYAELDDAIAFSEEEQRLQTFGDDFQVETAEAMRGRLTSPIGAAGESEVSLEDLDMEFQSGLDDPAVAVPSEDDVSVDTETTTNMDDGEDFAAMLDQGLDFESALDQDDEQTTGSSEVELDFSSDFATSDDNSLDFDLTSMDDHDAEQQDAPSFQQTEEVEIDNLMEFELSDEMLELDNAEAAADNTESDEVEADENSLDFDLGGLELPESELTSLDDELAELESDVADEQSLESLELDIDGLDSVESLEVDSDLEESTDDLLELDLGEELAELESDLDEAAGDELDLGDLAALDGAEDSADGSAEESAEEGAASELPEELDFNLDSELTEESLSELEPDAELAAELEAFAEEHPVADAAEDSLESEIESEAVDLDLSGAETESLEEFTADDVDAAVEEISESTYENVTEGVSESEIAEIDFDSEEAADLSLPDLDSALDDFDPVSEVVETADVEALELDVTDTEENSTEESASEDTDSAESEQPVVEDMADLDDLLGGDGEFDLDSLDFELDDLGNSDVEAPKLSQDDLNRVMEWDSEDSDEAEVMDLADVMESDADAEPEAEEIPALEDIHEEESFDLETLDAGTDFELTSEDTPDLEIPELDALELDSSEDKLEAELAAEDDIPELTDLPELDTVETAEELDADNISFTAADAIDLDELAEAEDEFEYLAGTDASETKLDLARAYVDMGESESARELLGEILQEGNDKQKQEAQSLMDSLN